MYGISKHCVDHFLMLAFNLYSFDNIKETLVLFALTFLFLFVGHSTRITVTNPAYVRSVFNDSLFFGLVLERSVCKLEKCNYPCFTFGTSDISFLSLA
jgi:hypothetical protein